MSKNIREQCQSRLSIAGKNYIYYSLPKLEAELGSIAKLPKSLKVLLENLLRSFDGVSVTDNDLNALVAWQINAHAEREIAYRPARVLMQDFTGVPAVVDLAAMREAISRLGGDPEKVNPLSPVDLVIDHSVTVDHYGNSSAFEKNVQLEMERNGERYSFLKWGQQAFDQFRVVPPGTGICHQVNLEYLGQAVWQQTTAEGTVAYPDTLVGTDSHTTMINALGVLGWGVGGIEAEAAMLGQPVSMLIPDVVGFELIGHLTPGITATDLVLTVTQMLRQHGVVGKFVEFYGDGLAHLPLADRATIANMAPEYGATCGFFPIDEVTIDYMTLSGRSKDHIVLTEAYAKAQGLWREEGESPIFTSSLSLDMSQVVASLAGPKRPQDRVDLANVPMAFKAAAELTLNRPQVGVDEVPIDGELRDGAVVIAAITSCTNTSNPTVLMTAGLLAKKAVEQGLATKPWVKSSLAPGSKVVTDYLTAAGLTEPLNQLGFDLVGYGCTTCIGNSGPLKEEVASQIEQQDLTVGAVLSGNRNFEGRIHPLVKTNWLASPPLVVAYALAGNLNCDLTKESLGKNKFGHDVYLHDVWPTPEEISQAVSLVTQQMFHKEYAQVFTGTEQWQQIDVENAPLYRWEDASTYIRRSPFFDLMSAQPEALKDIHGARILAMLGDSVTTDHISPAGAIKADSPAGRYLHQHGVTAAEFNSYGSRRGNHEVMVRGTFANIRIHNEIVPGTEGGITRHFPTNDVLPIYDAAMRYQEVATPLAIVAGKEYGSGSSRDWAAKGPRLQGVRVVIAESFERIHRSNLIGMGILPLEFTDGESRKMLQLTGAEIINISGLAGLQSGQLVPVVMTLPNGMTREVVTKCRIDTETELEYYRNDGILHYVIRNMLSSH